MRSYMYEIICTYTHLLHPLTFVYIHIHMETQTTDPYAKLYHINVGVKHCSRTEINKAQFSRSLQSSVILLLVIIFLAYCSVVVKVASPYVECWCDYGIIALENSWGQVSSQFSIFFFSETS